VYLGIVFTVSAIGAGIVIALSDAGPDSGAEGRTGDGTRAVQSRLRVFLNLAALAITGVLVWLSRRKSV
jgi:hypothetical protein